MAVLVSASALALLSVSGSGAHVAHSDEAVSQAHGQVEIGAASTLLRNLFEQESQGVVSPVVS